MRLDELEPEAVAAWFGKKVAERLSPASVNVLHVVLGSMFKPARQWKVPGAEVNPLRAIPHFGVDNAREPYLTAAETERVKAAIEVSPNRQLRCIIPLLLLTGAPLVLYGPDVEADVPTAGSNVAFDASHRARSPAWGLRDTADVKDVALRAGFAFAEQRAMPAHNLMRLFRKA